MQLYYGNLIEKAKAGEFDVIIHGCNCFHTMGAGIARHIRTNFPEAFEADLKTKKGDRNKLGTFSEVTLNINGHALTILNAYTQYNYGGGVDNFEYNSFPKLLKEIKEKFGDKKIGLPLIGCGLAGGDEPKILKMIRDGLEGVDYKLVEIDVNRKLNLGNEGKEGVGEKEYTFFFHLSSPFSNFHPSKINYKEIDFISNEQFMMYSKAKTFGDEITAKKILDINNEGIAKKFLNGELTPESIVSNESLSKEWSNLMVKIKNLGREVKNYEEDIWAKKREKVVLFGARLKFTQNEELKKKLLETGESLMVEASPYDKIWGIGLSAKDASITSPEKWAGLNLLGKILDQVKSELKNDNELVKKKSINNEIKVLNFYHLNKIIPEDGVYIGRYNKNFNLNSSKFANPFPMKEQTEGERFRVVQEYEGWLWEQIANNKITKEDLLGLSGKNLVCYCAPKSCHGDVLKSTVELLIHNEKEFNNRVNERKATMKIKF